VLFEVVGQTHTLEQKKKKKKKILGDDDLPNTVMSPLVTVSIVFIHASLVEGLRVEVT
jgi:hypothetical protein